MVTHWLGLFLLGSCFGKAAGALAAPAAARWIGAAVGLLALAGTRALPRRLARLLAAAAGLCWGVGHSAAPLPPAMSGWRVRVALVGAAAALVPDAPCPLVVELAYGRRGEAPEAPGGRFEAFGSVELGALGVAGFPDGERGIPRLFARGRARLRRVDAGAAHGDSPLAASAAALTTRLRTNLRRVDRTTAAWLGGILVADRHGMAPALSEAFRRAGLAHLLAASGLHVSLLVALAGGVLKLPFQLAYAGRLIGPRTWRHAAAVSAVLSALLAAVYLAATGMPIAAQRAALGFAMVQLCRVFFGVPPLVRRLGLTALAQTLLFPIGFVSEGMLMSWGAYLLVVDAAGAVRKRPKGGVRGHHLPWRAAVGLQLRLLALATAAYGQLSPIGLLANLGLVPVFVALLPLGLALAVWPQLPGRAAILALHHSFLEIVRHVAALAPAGGGLPAPVRAASVGLAAVLLLNTCRRLSIRGYESR